MERTRQSRCTHSDSSCLLLSKIRANASLVAPLPSCLVSVLETLSAVERRELCKTRGHHRHASTLRWLFTRTSPSPSGPSSLCTCGKSCF
ncbi:unnamed protein product, partial [Scytosiphon promiscuus]